MIDINLESLKNQHQEVNAEIAALIQDGWPGDDQDLAMAEDENIRDQLNRLFFKNPMGLAVVRRKIVELLIEHHT